MKVGTFDLESDGLLEDATRVWCAVVKDHLDGSITKFTPSNINKLCDHLASYDVLIGHNCIYFDFPLLRKLYGWEFKGKKVDTLLISRLQYPDRPFPKGYKGRATHSVEAWGYRVGSAKQGHEDWSKFSDEMLSRCAQDVEIQHKIYNALLDEGRGKGWMPAHKLNMKLFHFLQLQEEYGWTLDVDHVNRSLHRLNHWIVRIGQALLPRLPIVCRCLEAKQTGVVNWVRKPFCKDGSLAAVTLRHFGDDAVNVSVWGPFSRVAFTPVNIDSNEEIKDFLLAQGWVPSEWNTKDGKRTSAKLSKNDEFNGIQGSLGKLVAKRIQCRHRKSTLEGWLSELRSDGRISPKVNGIASTGRLKHAVIVNVPNPDSGAFFAKEMRRCFIAKPGWVMVGCDSKGNQMRQLAARMQDEEFTQAVLFGTKEEGNDLHSLNMKRANIPFRSRAKNFFYGCILFGAGDTKTANILETDINSARAIRESYFNEMPKLKLLLENLKEEWKKTAEKKWNYRFNKMEYVNGSIRGVDGRPIQVEFEKDLLAYALQSDEAIHMGVAYVMVHKEMERRGYVLHKDWGMLIWMHDEFQVECKPELAKELGEVMAWSIEWAGKFLKIPCPHGGDFEIGNNWAETH